jgi:hypothetical protein
MASQVKLTIKRGTGYSLKGVTVAAGVPEAQSDTISMNIDTTAATKGEVLSMIEGLKQKIQASKWPMM